MTPEELLKEVGEPVNFCSQYSLDRVAEYNNALVRIDSTFHEQSPVAIYTSDQVAAALLKATKPLEDQLAAAQEEISLLRDGIESLQPDVVLKEHAALLDQLAAAQEENGRLENQVLARDAELWGRTQEILGLKDQLAKAEQRVAEACALQVATETKFHWLDAARVAKEIRSGEWRKFVKEV